MPTGFAYKSPLGNINKSDSHLLRYPELYVFSVSYKIFKNYESYLSIPCMSVLSKYFNFKQIIMHLN